MIEAPAVEDGNPNPIQPYEAFGFELIDRAFGGPPVDAWENDFARIYWQDLEVHNGGFEQWIGNTGCKGIDETLGALLRFRLKEVHEISREAVNLVNFDDAWDSQAYVAHLDNNVDGWFEKLRALDSAYYDRELEVEEVLRRAFEGRSWWGWRSEGLRSAASPFVPTADRNVHAPLGELALLTGL